MNEPLWRISSIAAATDGECQFDVDAEISGISIDSRTLNKGDLYIAIVGDVHDGHRFVEAALKAGAGAALVRKDYKPEGDVGPLIYVDDTLRAMEALGQAARGRTDARVIAVTGSVGKTGTKEALRQCLEGQGKIHASVKSFNNHWGVPISLSRMPADTDYGVFEVGMNHPGEITPLVRFIRPHIAIITTVEPVHIEFFKSVEEIAAAKAEIFDGLEAGGIAILNRDNPHFEFLKGRAAEIGARVVPFGEHEEAEARILNVELHPDRSEVTADLLGQEIRFTMGIPGKHLVMNSMAVLAAIKLAGADVEKAAAVLANLQAEEGRGAKEVIALDGGDVAIVDESYNANPASMRAAIASFAQSMQQGYSRRIVVLGDMLELGDKAEQLHKDLKGPILDSGVDLVFACGEQMSGLFSTLPATLQGNCAANSEELIPELLKALGPGDAIMVKGSLGSRMGPVVEALKKHFR
ncbi:MAG: UDP-N-acetylmuramoylalanyl-D-glutamyl-2,6-diaminopimelate--D-alanyl-D-alanine ligase [Methyloligellaceae bacterium]